MEQTVIIYKLEKSVEQLFLIATFRNFISRKREMIAFEVLVEQTLPSTSIGSYSCWKSIQLVVEYLPVPCLSAVLQSSPKQPNFNGGNRLEFCN